MPTIQDKLRAMAGIHPGLNQTARDLLNDAADEIDRLQASKRAALKIADERTKENVRLRAALVIKNDNQDVTCA